MDRLQWDDSYCINVFDVDDRMKGFFNVVNKYEDYGKIKRKKEEDYDEIAEALADVSEYIRQHFSHEEKLLSQYRYPEFSQHKREHTRFIKRIMAFRRIYSEDPEKIYSDSVNYIRDWIVKHISNDDMRYAPFVRVQKYLNDQSSSGRRGR